MTQTRTPPIPHRIRVGDKLYSVDIVETMRGKREMGRVWYDAKRIEVGEKSNITGRSYTPDQVHNTFWHELVHAVLYEMGTNLYSNEKFVTDFANHLAKAIRSARFK